MVHPLLVIAGPTGSGKSELALRVAETCRGEVVNCDSLQIYRYFDIGTAKIPVEERRAIPHHLLDIIDPDATFSAGEYARLSRAALAGIAARGRLPIITGGTGFYLRALLDGLFQGPTRDTAMRERLAARETRRPGSLHRLIARLDPSSAARIHPNDTNKLVRALEVILKSRKPLSEIFRAGRDPLTGFRILKVALDPPRDQLYQRLDQRVLRMFDEGLIEEVRSILARGFPPTSKPFESLGYKQALQVIDGSLTPEQAIEETQVHTRRYAKRQWTWFRREPDIEWFAGFGGDVLTQTLVFERVCKFLDTPDEKVAPV